MIHCIKKRAAVSNHLLRDVQQGDFCLFLCSSSKQGRTIRQLDEKSDESLRFNDLFKQTTPTEQTGAQRSH